MANIEKLKVGDPAPDFSTVDEAGNPVSLKGLRGKTIVLYFYPKDNTPGCTIEAKKFRDHIGEFEKKGAVVLGVSSDDRASHQSFKERHELPFPLLIDEEKKIAKAYGASGMLFPSRHTILIDPRGKIKKVYRSVSPAEHAQEVLGDL